MAIDSHMHINSILQMNQNAEIDLINSNDNLNKVINVGLNIKTSKEANKIALDNDKFYSSIGIHPLYIEYQNIDELKNMVTPKTVAVGEIGLDNKFTNNKLQRKYLIEQIMIANELGLPVIIHSNNSNKEIFEIFDTIVRPLYGCVFHSFQPDLNDLEYILFHGYYVSFCGRITYKNNERSTKVISRCPFHSILVETDAPYFAPYGFKDIINHSSNVSYVISRIANIKKENEKTIDDITEENTRRLFKRL